MCHNTDISCHNIPKPKKKMRYKQILDMLQLKCRSQHRYHKLYACTHHDPSPSPHTISPFTAAQMQELHAISNPQFQLTIPIPSHTPKPTTHTSSSPSHPFPFKPSSQHTDSHYTTPSTAPVSPQADEYPSAASPSQTSFGTRLDTYHNIPSPESRNR